MKELDNIRLALETLHKLQAGDSWTEHHWRTVAQLEKDIENLVLHYTRRIMNLTAMIEVNGHKVVTYPTKKSL